MGSSQSQTSAKSDYGDISLRHDSSLFMASTELKGSMVVNIYRPYPLRTAEVLVQGSEIVTSGELPSRVVILSETIPLQLPAVNGIVQPGQYIMPFTCPLPLNLPGTFWPANCGRASGAISYNTTGRLNSLDTRIPSMMITTPFVVRQPLLFESNCPGRDEKEVRSVFSNKGVSTLEVVLSKNGIHLDEELNANITLDNTRCTTEIKRVVCTLYQEVKMTFKDTALATKEYKTRTKVHQWTGEGVRAGGHASYIQPFSIPLEKQLPSMETVHGNSISQAYILEVVPIYDLSFVQTKPKLEYFVNVTSLPSKVVHVPAQAPKSQLQPQYLVQFPAPQPDFAGGMPMQPQMPQPVQPQMPIADGYMKQSKDGYEGRYGSK